MDAQQLKEIERYVMGTMGVVLLMMWLFVKWALKKSRDSVKDTKKKEIAIIDVTS